MERYRSASEMVQLSKPDRPVLGLRPHAAARAARWFIENFDGEVAYAYKANSSVFLIGALYGAGIRAFDVASLPELEDAVTIPDAELHFMHPVKSRSAIRRAYGLGVRNFSLDSEDELEKMVAETSGAKDLKLFVRLTVPARDSMIPLEHKFGVGGAEAADLLVKTRQVAHQVGVTFHVGSQTGSPEAFTLALTEVGRLIGDAGVVVDCIDVGGGFPAHYGGKRPPPLRRFLDAIDAGIERLPVREDVTIMCEPGRALVAEAESLIVRVDARRGDELFINDGGYGVLFDAAHLEFTYPAKLVGRVPKTDAATIPYRLWGPTCDSIDCMNGPFELPSCIREGDYIEIHNVGAYGRAIAGHFNGYGAYDEAILLDEPMLSMYADQGVSSPATRNA